MQLITEAFLRALCLPAGSGFALPAGAKLSPLAEEFARAQHLKIAPFAQSEGAPWHGEMPMTQQSPVPGGKPEHMTHLNGTTLVLKTHPRIQLRGKLDSLEALVLLTLQEAQGAQRQQLEEVYTFTQAILGCEVKATPMPPLRLFGLNSAELRRASHHPKEFAGIAHPVPHGDMGRLSLALNYLRTQVREAELCAVNAFAKGTRPDLIEALNRLSSAVYLLFLKSL
ncbi:MAG: hypothetical protein LBB50_06195 [Oscillospiraceae bacterium]|jgi:ethanolamine utilization cobalamin adenosyltransferase|nr:hypothetical protein [Oscillospiraceae bacterium]